jgi:hypothetical protein
VIEHSVVLFRSEVAAVPRRWGVASSALTLLLLKDGPWVRAVVRSISSGSGDHESPAPPRECLTAHAAALLARFGGSPHWASALAWFLQDREVSCPQDSDIEVHASRVRAEIEAGIFDEEVWDFSTGRLSQVRQLKSRGQSYACAVANVGEIQLHARFTQGVTVRNEDVLERTALLAAWLNVIVALDIKLLSLQSHPDRIVLEVESTVEQWFGVYEGMELEGSRYEAMARDLIRNLNLPEPAFVVAQKLRELEPETHPTQKIPYS